MKKSISALAVLASAITANAQEQIQCIPAYTYNNQTEITALCDAKDFNLKYAKELGKSVDATTGCLTETKDVNDFSSVVSQATYYVWSEGDVILKKCTEDQAMVFMVEL